MKTAIAVSAGLLALALAAPAAASPREYQRGYYDCMNGRFDDDGGRSYREGCRDAQREQGGGGGWGQGGGGGGWNGGGGQPGWGQGGGGGWNGGGPGNGGGWNGGGGQPGWGQNGGGGGGNRPGWGQNGGGGQRPAGGGIPNVKGMDAGGVMGAMAARGYRNVGTELAGAAVYGFYFNPATGECVQVASLNGHAVGATPSNNSRCR